MEAVNRCMNPKQATDTQAGTSNMATMPVMDLERARLAEDLVIHQEELRAQEEQLKETQRQLEASRDQYAELYDFAPVAYLTLDQYGNIQAINLTGCAVLEMERAKVLQMPLARLVHPEDRPRLSTHLRQCLSSSLSVFEEVRLRTASGKSIPVQLTSKQVSETCPGAPCIRMAMTDLTQRKRTEEKINELNVGLEKRVAERTAELERITSALALANRTKDNFLAMLGHELRNPLGPIRNALEVWRMTEAETADPSIGQMRQIIDRQVAHMSRIIDDLLDVSRISRGKIVLRQSVLDLVKLAECAVNDLRGDLECSGLTLKFEAPDKPVWVQADGTRMAQTLTNLLTNACKFTDRGGTVAVRVTADGDQAQIAVRDTGIGMTPEMLARVFEPFTQADQSLDRTRGGLGLGLSLVRGLMDLHGGDVTVASEGLGKGCEFTLSLPLTSRSAMTPHTAPARSAPRALRILVIDDGHDTVITMRALLQKLGHEVAIAHDGEQGLEIAGQFHPEVVFSDIGLPGIDGYTVASRLREDARFTDTRLVAVTGYGQREDQQHAHDAGFDEHLTKPVAFSDLQRLLAALA